MGYTAGADVSAGDVINSAKWNQYAGASGSIDYLKTEADKLNACTQTDQTGSRALGTIYQNTGGYPMFVCVTAQVNGVAKDASLQAFSDNDTPPVDEVARRSLDTSTAEVDRANVIFVVPNSYYYKVVDTGSNLVLVSWIEWGLHT
jgi:hypothetical protein